MRLSSSIRFLFLMAAVVALLFAQFHSAYGGAEACMIRSGHEHGFVLKDPSLPFVSLQGGRRGCWVERSGGVPHLQQRIP